jgi:C1A family cysteine protease
VIAAAFEFDRRQKKLPDFMPSRLFIYWNERDIEGTTAHDAGANIRDGIKVLARHGACDETKWPYKISQFAKKPPNGCYKNAFKYTQLNYYYLENADLDELKNCLAAGYPFLLGFGVCASFFKGDRNGMVPMPVHEPIVGGHAVIAAGYSDKSKRFIVRSSWGPSRGDGGYYYMPYQYLTNRALTGRFWTIRTL